MLVPEKGLVNRVGENNCFLNVCIQALWHLGPFRDKFLHATALEAAPSPVRPRQARHVHGPSCVFCALRVIFPPPVCILARNDSYALSYILFFILLSSLFCSFFSFFLFFF